MNQSVEFKMAYKKGTCGTTIRESYSTSQWLIVVAQLAAPDFRGDLSNWGPLFFVSVADKGLRVSVSLLDAPLTRWAVKCCI